jgi:hypothetical protein
MGDIRISIKWFFERVWADHKMSDVQQDGELDPSTLKKFVRRVLNNSEFAEELGVSVDFRGKSDDNSSVYLRYRDRILIHKRDEFRQFLDSGESNTGTNELK